MGYAGFIGGLAINRGRGLFLEPIAAIMERTDGTGRRNANLQCLCETAAGFGESRPGGGVLNDDLYFLWQFRHRVLPLTAWPSTVVPGPELLTHSMLSVPLRLCGSWQEVQPTAISPVGKARRGMM